MNRIDDTTVLVAGLLLPRIELLDVRVLRRFELALGAAEEPTLVVWPGGDRGRPDDVCWTGIGRSRREELGRGALPPLPAVEFHGDGLERLEGSGRLHRVLREQGLVREHRFDMCLHAPGGALDRLTWSVRLAAAPAHPCHGRRRALRPRARLGR